VSFAQDLSLRHKLTAIIMLTCVAALSLVGGVFMAWEWTSLRRATVRNLATHAEILADDCRRAVTFNDAADANDILRTAEVVPSITMACILTGEDKLFAVYRRPGRPCEGLVDGLLTDGHRFTRDFVAVARPIRLKDKRIGTLCLTAELGPLYDRLRRSVAIVVSVFLLASAAAYLISSRLQRVISSPILYLAGVANFVSEKKQYAYRARRHGNDEVGLLVQAFNEMLAQIQKRDADLVNANEQLEARVRDRTTALTAANQKLTHEIAVRKRAEQMLKRRTERIVNHQRALLKLAKTTANDLDQTISKTTEEAAQTLAVERLSVWFLDEKPSALICRDLYQSSRRVHEKGMALKTSHHPAYLEWMERHRLLAATDAQNDPRMRELRQNYLKPLGISSAMGVPIRLHGRLLGVICCEHVGPLREWALEEQDFVSSIADMIALQIETNERRRVERALARANEHLAETVRELRRSNKELQDFAYVAAHDLKAPLRGIGTLADWIAGDYADLFDDAGREQVRLLKARVCRMNELIDSILHYAEIGRTPACIESVDLSALLSEVIADVGPPAHVRVVLDDPLPVILAEKTRVRQVFQNLLTNAVKYIDKPQGRIDIGVYQEDAYWRFTVSDNGPGIEQKYFEKIFQMFQTLAPRDECESTGIGLAIVKKIVELASGTIAVDSTLGEGTTFTFTLPRRERSAKPSEASHVV
jgi:signal transduction histidine kinase/HAMP domain-containing protein